MRERTIKTTLQLEGGERYRAEVKAICTDLECLGRHIDTVQKRVAQLNESLKELIKLRDISG